MSYHDSPIIPSIIATNQHEFSTRLMKTSFAHAVHIDVMDGNFVSAVSFDCDEDFQFSHLQYFKKVEVHLMVLNPTHWIEYLSQVATLFIIHAEIPRAQEMIEYIRSLGLRAGIALNPESDIADYAHLLVQVDHVTVMTVHPGAYGAAFLPEMLAKVHQLRSQYPSYDIECDGSMNEQTITDAKKAGANLFIAGSILQNTPNPQLKFELLNQLLKSVE